MQSHGRKQQPYSLLEVINVEETPSPDTTQGRPIVVVEET
jgi:hypothetical protein